MAKKGFEPWIYGLESNHSGNWAITTAQFLYFLLEHKNS